MEDKINLKALGIEFARPENIILHDEGYMSVFDLFNKCSILAVGRPLLYREWGDMNFNGLAASNSYSLALDGKKEMHIHICVIEEVKGKYPLEMFVRAHEETSILHPCRTNRYDLLKEKLKSLNVDSSNFSELKSMHEIEHVGGLSCLYSNGIDVGNKGDKLWNDFLQQFQEGLDTERYDVDPQLFSALNWFLGNKK